MNNQFSQRVSDIITYSKEEANRLKNRYIGPEHLLLGMLRDGGGKAIEILLFFCEVVSVCLQKSLLYSPCVIGMRRLYLFFRLLTTNQHHSMCQLSVAFIVSLRFHLVATRSVHTPSLL